MTGARRPLVEGVRSKLQIVWKYRPTSQFQGSWLEVVGDVVVFESLDALEGLSREGFAVWKLAESGTNFHGFGGQIYVGGTRARRIDPARGVVQAEREFGTDVRVFIPTLDAVPYSGKRPMSFFGLDHDDLSTAWEYPDRQQEFTAHDRRLCRPVGAGGVVNSLSALPGP